MADNLLCVHEIISEVNGIPVEDPGEEASQEQLAAGVMELLSAMLHEPPTPEQLESCVAILKVLDFRYAGYVQQGIMTDEAASPARLGIGEMLIVLSAAYVRPATEVAELEAMLADGAHSA
jgi:hypothetical protein